jgi:hypothetical protein
MPRALVWLLAAIVTGQVLALLPHPAALAIIVAILWLALPGVALVRAAGGPASPPLAAWLMGPGLGLGFSVLGMLPFWAIGLQNWLTVLLGPALTWLLAFVFHRIGGIKFRWVPFDRRDVIAAALALAVVPLITWAPYTHVRHTVPEGEAYRAYFTADFVWAMTVTSELAKGEMPPVNPFLSSGETLQYYWMAHFLSGTLYRNVSAWGVTPEPVILIDGLAFGLGFAALIYGLARLSGASPGFACLAVAVGFCANSYEGINRIVVLRDAGLPLQLLTDYNIDSVTRWFYQGMPVDGMQRLLLYQPHHLNGYVLGLTALWVVARAEDVGDLAIPLIAGTLLAMTFLFSTFSAVILSAAVGLLYAWRIVQQRAWRSLVLCAVLGGGVAAIGALMTQVLGYTDPAARNWPFMLFLSFGPLLLFGIAGLLRGRWALTDGAPAAALTIVGLAFYFLVDVPDMDGVWVGWRAGHQLFVAFVVSSAVLATTVWQRRAWRLPATIAAMLAIAPAVPTVVIDVYNAQDVWNRAPGPGFPWTLIITPPEREALDWLRRNTPADAVVQMEPIARGAGHWSYIPAFGERRMAAGLPIAMIPLRKFQQASDVVRLGIFEAASAADAHSMARALRIDYLLIGATERRQYPSATRLIVESPEWFTPVFQNEAVIIVAVRR